MAIESPRRQHNRFRYASAVLRWIIEPPASVEEKQRRRLSLLSAFLLLITINTLIGAITIKNAGNNSWPLMLATAAVLAAGYILSRTGYHRLATVIAVVIPAFPIFSMALFRTNQANIPAQLPWLALPLLISSILLPLRRTVIVAVIYLAFIVLLIPFVDVPVANMSESLAFVIMISLFMVAITSVRQHDQSEIERQLIERKRAEEKQKAIIQTALDGFWLCDIKGKILEVNDSYCRMIGYTRKELLEMSIQNIEAIEKPEQTARRIKKIVENGSDRFETRHKRKDGKIIDIEISVNYLNIDEGLMVVFVRDITRRKRVQKLQQDENYVLTLLSQGAELSELLDAIVRLGESRNPAIKGSVLLFDSSRDWLVPGPAPSLPDDYKELMVNGIPIGPVMGSCGTAAYRKERVIVPDIENSPLFKGSEEAVKLAVNNGLLACWSQPIIASNGDLLGTIANYSTKKGKPDIVDLRVLEWSAHIAAIAIEHKQAEEALANEAIRRRILIEQSSDGIVILDQNGKVYEANRRFAEMLGYSPEEVRQLNVWDWEFLFPPEQVVEMIRSIDETGDHFETQHRRKDGTTYDVEISTNGVVFAGEKLIFCVCRDITERKQAEEKLKHTLTDLEQSSTRLAATNQELETFSYSVSHDLRSPLRSIDGFSQALLEDYRDKLDEQGQDYLKRLRGASQKMGELIDGLLKLSRLTRSEIHEEPVDLSALAEEITSRLKETRRGRKVEFIIDKGLSASGDPQLLRVLLENLLGNAWKFTGKSPHAKIEFGVTRNNGKNTYFVKDNGAGFDMTYSNKLFGAFQRLHDTSEYPGTGIGLATVQRIINRHGGTIRAEGAVGKGATFYFTLD